MVPESFDREIRHGVHVIEKSTALTLTKLWILSAANARNKIFVWCSIFILYSGFPRLELNTFVSNFYWKISRTWKLLVLQEPERLLQHLFYFITHGTTACGAYSLQFFVKCFVRIPCLLTWLIPLKSMGPAVIGLTVWFHLYVLSYNVGHKTRHFIFNHNQLAIRVAFKNIRLPLEIGINILQRNYKINKCILMYPN